MHGVQGDGAEPDDPRHQSGVPGDEYVHSFWRDNGLALVGSPGTVIRQGKEQHQRLGYDIFCANHRLGTMPTAQSLQSLQVFDNEAIPAFP